MYISDEYLYSKFKALETSYNCDLTQSSEVQLISAFSS